MIAPTAYLWHLHLSSETYSVARIALPQLPHRQHRKTNISSCGAGDGEQPPKLSGSPGVAVAELPTTPAVMGSSINICTCTRSFGLVLCFELCFRLIQCQQRDRHCQEQIDRDKPADWKLSRHVQLMFSCSSRIFRERGTAKFAQHLSAVELFHEIPDRVACRIFALLRHRHSRRHDRDESSLSASENTVCCR